MENLKTYFSVIYVDDFGKKHFTIAKNIAELNFIRDRFDTVNFQLVNA